jgi:hypothetical protein
MKQREWMGEAHRPLLSDPPDRPRWPVPPAIPRLDR